MVEKSKIEKNFGINQQTKKKINKKTLKSNWSFVLQALHWRFPKLVEVLHEGQSNIKGELSTSLNCWHCANFSSKDCWSRSFNGNRV